MEPDEKTATRKSIPRRGLPMPIEEQDLVQDLVGNVDQKHLGMSYVTNNALLELKRAEA